MIDFDFVVAYVLTSCPHDHYAAMTLVSALSLKISNPRLAIILLCDKDSANYLRNSARHLLEAVDEFLVIETPLGSATFRNRWIKTRLGSILPGNVLFLDSDTLVRRSLADIPSQVRQFGAVPNHNGSTLAEQIWDEDRENLRAMGWSERFESYINGGMWMYCTCDAVNTFFQTWHETWLQSVKITGRMRDQPSLNRAIADTGLDLTILPRAYNEQLAFQWDHAPDAAVWHFYASNPLARDSFNHLVRAAKMDSIRSLRKKVARAIAAAAPWPNIDPLAIRLSHRVANQKTLRTWEQMWLDGRRQQACRWLLSSPFRRLKAMQPIP